MEPPPIVSSGKEMKDLYPYSIKTLEEMFALRKGDVQLLVDSEGIPLYSYLRKEFIGYLPSLGAAFPLTSITARKCATNIDVTKMSVNLEESVLVIRSTDRRIPSSSFLYTNIWLQNAQTKLDVTNPDFSLLIPAKPDAPIFCGHKKIINRLAINFEGDIEKVNVNYFIRWQS